MLQVFTGQALKNPEEPLGKQDDHILTCNCRKGPLADAGKKKTFCSLTRNQFQMQHEMQFLRILERKRVTNGTRRRIQTA